MLNTSELRPRRQLGEGAHGGGKNVFEMALSGMDQMMIGWMMVAVVFSQLVLDEVLRRAEASVGTNARACLREVYKELSTVSTVLLMPARPSSSHFLSPAFASSPFLLIQALPPHSIFTTFANLLRHMMMHHARNATEVVEAG